MDYSNYESAGKWYSDARKNGWNPCCAMMQGITLAMKKFNMTFPEAFKYLEDNKKIFLVGNTYIFDLSCIEYLASK